MLKFRLWVLAVLLLGLTTVVGAQMEGPKVLSNMFPFRNATGILKTFNATGPLDLTGPFFQSLGTNGRSCATCHQPSDAWSVSAAHVAERFEQTQGLDPLFRTNDGSTCNHGIETSSVGGREQAYSLLIKRGLFRIAIDVPAGAEFDVVKVSNPYGCEETSTLSMYRRPLPSTNLRFLSAVMWDGRESSTETGTKPITFSSNTSDLMFDLAHQAVGATDGHAEAFTQLTGPQQQQIVAFEMGLSPAQAVDFLAGFLDSDGATGGPLPLVTEPFFIGINDTLGENPYKTPFTPVVFSIFEKWKNGQSDKEEQATRRASILRGQKLFNNQPMNIFGVGGLNDVLGNSVVKGTCGTCHDAPNVGHHSVALAVDIGVSDPAGPLDVGYLPVITLRKKADPTQQISTTDPGRALVTGKWADIGKFKGPILRGLAARAPYFHNGSASTLKDVIEFYNARFEMGLSEQDKTDFAAFMSVL